MSKYRIISASELPPPRIKLGRPNADNNDAELVKLAIQGLLDGTYRSYRHAARSLQPYAKQRVRKKIHGKNVSEYVLPATCAETTIKRLSRKISHEYKEITTRIS